MAAHRYWRATAFESYGGGDLELSEFHLLSVGVRVDATATLTASVAPDAAGVIANLQDDVLTTSARWSAQAVKALTLQWDFGGSTADIGDIRLAGGSEWRFPLIVKMQWSDNAVSWTDVTVLSGVSWPGPLAKTMLGLSTATGLVAALNFDGSDGSTNFTDLTGRAWTATGGAAISTSNGKAGQSGLFTGGSISTPSAPDLDLGLSYTVQCWIRPSSLSNFGLFHRGFYSTSGNSWDGLTLSVRHLNGNTLRFYYFATAYADEQTVDVVGALSIGTYTHIAMVRDVTAGRVYVNGVLAGSITGLNSPAVSTRPLKVGVWDYSSGAEYFSGNIDLLKISNEVEYTGSFTPPDIPFAFSSVGSNAVRGRAAVMDGFALGSGPALTYGTPKIALPDYLSIESGSVKDQINGVLGEGIGRVNGTVATKGSPNQPVHRKVRLIRERDGVVIREAWSNAVTGEYDFKYVDELQTYTVVSYDHLHNYRAVIADNLVPELMP